MRAMEKKNLNLEEVDQNDEVFFVVYSNSEQQFPMHKHGKHQLYYVENGIAFFNTPTNSFFLPAHHFLWIPAGIEHFITSRTSVKMVYCLYIPAQLTKGIPKLETSTGIYPVNNLMVEMINYTQGWYGEVGPEQNFHYQFLLTLTNIIAEASQKTSLPIELPTTDNEDLRQVLKYIHRNISQNLNLQTIAEQFGYSTRSLSRLFQNNINTSFLQYVKLLRIIKAMELLLQTNLSISEISYMCGYNTLSSFSYVFQKVVHASPAEFKKKTRQIKPE